MIHKEIVNAKKTIQNWINVSYNPPEIYKRFFIQWALVNLFYSANFPEKNKEWDKLLNFGRNFSFLFNSVKDRQEVQVLIKEECVGRGILTSKPSKYVKKATLMLREIYGLSEGCINCREPKKQLCQNIPDVPNNFIPFEALIIIIYQIRCNLFHGEKLDIFEDQNSRDKKLVEASSSILDSILRLIII